MTRIVKRCLAVSLMLTMFLGGTALAATTYQTSLTLNASRTHIHRGQKVVFSGKLKSTFAKCYKHQTVTLYRNDRAAGSTTTSSTGSYSFTRHPRRTRTWQVRFAGDTGGTHPNQFVCAASRSNTVRVRFTAELGSGQEFCSVTAWPDRRRTRP